jgi:hypothetical protein
MSIEFPDGSRVLATQLLEDQRVTVLQLPVAPLDSERAQVQSPLAANENETVPAA